MKPHDLFSNCQFIGFPETHRAIKGVYSINDDYVGASLNIRQRILKHIRISKVSHEKGASKTILSNENIIIKLLDDNPYNEHLYKERSNKHEKFYHEMYK